MAASLKTLLPGCKAPDFSFRPAEKFSVVSRAANRLLVVVQHDTAAVNYRPLRRTYSYIRGLTSAGTTRQRPVCHLLVPGFVRSLDLWASGCISTMRRPSDRSTSSQQSTARGGWPADLSPLEAVEVRNKTREHARGKKKVSWQKEKRHEDPTLDRPHCAKSSIVKHRRRASNPIGQYGVARFKIVAKAVLCDYPRVQAEARTMKLSVVMPFSSV